MLFIVKFKMLARYSMYIHCVTEPMPQYEIPAFIQILNDNNHVLECVEPMPEEEEEEIMIIEE